MTPSWYDVLDVEPTASRRRGPRGLAGRASPTWSRARAGSRRSTRPPRCCWTSSGVRRTTPSWPPRRPEPTPEPTPEPAPAGRPTTDRRPPARVGRRCHASTAALAVPDRGCCRVLLGVVAGRGPSGPRLLGVAAPSDERRRGRRPRRRRSAAERAIVPVLSYDYETLEADQKRAAAYLTGDYREELRRALRGDHRQRPVDPDQGQRPTRDRVRHRPVGRASASTCSSSSTGRPLNKLTAQSRSSTRTRSR